MDLDEKTPIQWTRINRDINGNSRHICHFFDLLSPEEIAQIAKKAASNKDNTIRPRRLTSPMYSAALARAHKLGGKKYHNRQFGGGIVFQTCDTETLEKDIRNLIENDRGKS